MPYSLFAVDVFADGAYTGNPLAVVIGSGLSDELMQRIAAEINYSETTFVDPGGQSENRYGIRMFTPAREVAFAGHPILGTAWVIRQYVAPKTVNEIMLRLSVGEIPVRFERSSDGRDAPWFRAPEATFGSSYPREPVARALGLSPGDIETTSPIQALVAGVSVLIVPLRGLDALRRCRLDLNAFAPLAAQGAPSLVYLFCRQALHPANDLSARFFFEAYGVREDPATGNGAALLGAYLLQHAVLGVTDLSLRIEQGHEVRRPSLVMLRARMSGGVREVSVGGHVYPTIKGELL
ncbi:MAG: PhzF family phenazine biosynthesis protein [Betaproteobacteria bacterium]|nr:PhzF family phenazine biosynthesis protein [Betaproteobacteria bacterium]